MVLLWFLRLMAVLLMAAGAILGFVFFIVGTMATDNANGEWYVSLYPFIGSALGLPVLGVGVWLLTFSDRRFKPRPAQRTP